jgi:hypothetical protein
MQSRCYELDRSNRVFEVDPERREEEHRINVKTQFVIGWLKQQKKEHLIMPNEECTVLPYKDKQEAHTAFVLELERLVKFEHQQRSVDIVFANGLAMQDINAPVEEEQVMHRDEAAEVVADALSIAKESTSRYGNTTMGHKSTVPEAKEIASFSFFCTVWRNADKKTYKKTIKLRKWMPFAKCDTCATHRTAMGATKCPKEKSRLKALQREHLLRVKRERQSYLVRQRLSIMYPDRYLSLIIDGADSSSFMLPHLAERSHASDACPKVKMHVLGCIAHGRDTYAFTCPPHIAQGHNITIQVIHEVLLEIKRSEGRIPPILHIQLDNTTKQNKGRFLMAYLAYLVQQGVIKEAYCNFLPVGHTHEDIDQFFSRISVYMRHHNAPDPDTLLACIRRCFKKYGRYPIVRAWDTVANTSAYFGRFTTKNLSKDITLYYQLRISMGKNGNIASQPIMQARTWPGAANADENDFWRGLLPDTSYVQVFKKAPKLLEDRHLIPTQAQPEHIGELPGTQVRSDYATSLEKQRASIEHLMKTFPHIFKEKEKKNVGSLLDALASNLSSSDPTPFDWPEADMAYLYGEGQYVDLAPAPIHEDAVDPNLFDDDHILTDLQDLRPNGMLDPSAFQRDVDEGRINLQLVENVRACILKVGSFYLQRPASLGIPFNLMKVVKIHYNADETQWGAWVHPWEISTTGDDVDYFTDPWHQSGAHKAAVRYNPKRAMNCQSVNWTYPMCLLSEFQDEVVMNKEWLKPKGWKKTVIAGWGVKKRNIRDTDRPRIRNFTHRWSEAEQRIEKEKSSEDEEE